MITKDDNAKRNYERVKRWREKNRGLVNLRQREYRKRKTLGGVESSSELATERPNDIGQVSSDKSAPSKLFETKKVGEFRMLVLPEQPKEEPEMPVVASSEALRGGGKPKVFFNDHGAQISEKVWEALQEKKRVALESGYEFDPQWI